MICNTYKEFFKAICNESRIEILFLLKKNALTVGDVVKTLKKEQSAVSHNLRKLKKKGFVKSTVKGKERIYSLEKETKELLEIIDKHVGKNFHEDCKCR